MCRGELPKIDRSSDSVRLGFDRKSKRRETRLRALCVPSHLGLGPGCKNKEKPMTVCNRRSRVFSLFLTSQASVPITTIQFQVRCSATWALVAFAPRCARGSFCSLALQTGPKSLSLHPPRPPTLILKNMYRIKDAERRKGFSPPCFPDEWR